MTLLARTSVYWIKATTEGARPAQWAAESALKRTDTDRESAHTLCVCLLFGLDQLLNLIYKHAARPTKYKGVIRKHAKSALASRRPARGLGEYAGAQKRERGENRRSQRRSAPHSLASR